MKPGCAEFTLPDTHRLIPSKYSDAEPILGLLARAGEDDIVGELESLDAATNTRLRADQGVLPGISIHELVYGVRYSTIVNAAFTCAAPYGGRFNTSDRGAWYGGLERETSEAEVAFHLLRQLEEVAWKEEEAAAYDDYLADFHAEFHSLVSGDPDNFSALLKPDPIPECYREPQALATALLAAGSNGIVFPSVRRADGTCIVCFRPALVYHVRRGARLEFLLRPGTPLTTRQVREIAG